MRAPLSDAPRQNGLTIRTVAWRVLPTALAALFFASCIPTPPPPPARPPARPVAPRLTPAPNVAGDPENGRRLFTASRIYPANGCGTCHTLPGVSSGTFPGAPNLNNVTLRPTLAGEAIQASPENMKRWIMDPPAMKERAAMPKLQLTDQEAQDLTAFLYSQPHNPTR